MAKRASVIGAFIVMSLIGNVTLLGFQSGYSDALKNVTFPITHIAVFGVATLPIMFFEAVWFIFELFGEMGKKPE